MGVNATQFEQELNEEIERRRVRTQEFKADVVTEALKVARHRSRVKTGALRDSWGGSTKRKRGRWLPTAALEQQIRKAPVFRKFYIGSNDFKATWHEYGSPPQHGARPMLRIGLLVAQRRVERA